MRQISLTHGIWNKQHEKNNCKGGGVKPRASGPNITNIFNSSVKKKKNAKKCLLEIP